MSRPIRLLILPCLALAACSDGGGNMVDVDAAATAAQNDIDNYAAASRAKPSPAPSPSATVAASEPAVPPETVAERPFSPESEQGAGDVVQRYYALIGEGRYAQAWRLWDGAGQASGMTADAFAASFAPYATYSAQIGAPRNADAGAGQRYIQVPVRITGMRKNGERFVLAGALTLHRVADGIESDDPDAHAWRISQSAVRPLPAEAGADGDRPAVVAATYGCEGGVRFTVRFDTISDVARIRIDGKSATLDGQRPASGIWYKGNGYELRGKGKAATLTPPNGSPLRCTAG